MSAAFNMEDEAAYSPFASAGPKLVAQGFSAIPIMPGDKIPGLMVGDEWRFHKGWNRFCLQTPGAFQTRLWSKWPRAGVGVALGRGLLAVDIDRDDLVSEVLAVLPPVVVAKRGRKGLTIFYHGDTERLRSRGFKIDGFGVLDFLSFGKQTVLPPSLHPATGLPYEWTTEKTLLDVKLDELPEFTAEHFEALVDVLKANGWKPEPTFEASGEIVESDDSARDFFRKLNEDALANLDAWVPKLGLPKAHRQSDGGWRAVPEWRPSNSGNPTQRRKTSLSFDRKGIVDFGNGDKPYTALNVVMAAMGLPQHELALAATWLGEHLGYDFAPQIVLTNSKPKTEVVREPEPEPSAAPEGLAQAADTYRAAQSGEDARQAETAADAPPTPSIDPFRVQQEPSLLGEVARWVMSVAYRPIPEFAVLCSLAVLSVIFGRRYETPTGSGLNLYLVGLASTAVGKDDPLDAAQVLLDECGMRHLIGPGDVTSDSAIETVLRVQPCFLMPMDEIGVFLQGMSARNAGGFERRIRKALLELYSKSSKVWTGKQRADAGRINAAEPIYCPTVSILGFSVVDGFYDGLTEQNLSDGFMNRLTVITASGKVESNTLRPRVTAPDALIGRIKAAANASVQATGNLAAVAAREPGLRPNLHRIAWDEDVRLRWLSIERRQQFLIERDSALQGIIGRSAEQTLKIASIRAIARDPAEPRIALEDVEWAHALVLRSVETISKGVADHMAGSDFEALCKCIERYAKEAGPTGIAWSHLMRKKGISRAEPRFVKAAIDRLVEQHAIFDPDIGSPKGGAPGKRIRARFGD
jgi:hypothetical protein